MGKLRSILTAKKFNLIDFLAALLCGAGIALAALGTASPGIFDNINIHFALFPIVFLILLYAFFSIRPWDYKKKEK